jgi:LCCL domain-containing protein
MSSRIWCVMLAAAMAAAMPVASAQQASIGISGTDSATGFRYQTGRRLVFICPTIDMPSQEVWGTDVYADNSAICSAAMHAGFLPLGRAGLVSIVIGGEASSFMGSTRNGVTSTSYGNSDYTYTFSPTTEPAAIDWTTTVLRIPPDFDQPVTVICPRGGKTDAFVWGTDVYINDSAICVAAVHAGIITLDGGAVTVTKATALKAYEASLRNGVQSMSWTDWPGAFTVAAANAIPGTTAAGGGRTIRVAGFTGTGNAVEVVPRTIRLTGYTGRGTGPEIVPRTIVVSGWTGTGLVQ